jgi:hypothetical protein
VAKDDLYVRGAMEDARNQHAFNDPFDPNPELSSEITAS